MDLKKVFSYYNSHQKSPIPYEIFHKEGWSENDFLEYLGCIEAIRSIMILWDRQKYQKRLRCADKPLSDSYYNKILRIEIYNLEIFFQQFLNEPFSLSEVRRLFKLSLFRKGIRYIPDMYFDYPEEYSLDCTLVYITTEDVRIFLEKVIYCILNNIEPSFDLSEIQREQRLKLLADSGDIKTLKKLANESFKKFMKPNPNIKLDLSHYYRIQQWADIESHNITRLHNQYDWDEDIDDAIKEAEEKIYTPDKILYIHAGNNILCKEYGHHIVSVNGSLPTVNGERVILNINYCLDCRKFFISLSEYEAYREKYPGLLAKFVFVTEKGYDYNVQRSEYSLLSLNGYSARENGLSEKERQEILAAIIDNGIMEKFQVIDHLSLLINTNGRKSHMEAAVIKWSADIDFVRNYNMENQATYKLKEAQKYKRT